MPAHRLLHFLFRLLGGPSEPKPFELLPNEYLVRLFPKPSPIQHLPVELLLKITQLLSPRNLGFFLRTNRKFSQLLMPEFNKLALTQKPKASCTRGPPYKQAGITTLHWAVSRGHYSLARYLLGHGVHVDFPERHWPDLKDLYWRPLHIAACDCDNGTKIVLLLLDNGADIEALDQNGRTPLHFATAENTAILLRKGAAFNAKDIKGYTPLHLATAETTTLLLRAGADVNAKDKNRHTPLHYANEETATLLLRAGADINSNEGDGHTPLHFAAEGDLGFLRVLLENGADTEARDRDSYTALHCAIINYCNPKSRTDLGMRGVQLLLEHGANPEALTLPERESPIHLAIYWWSGDRKLVLPIVRLLLDKGANVEAINSAGHTLLHLAVEFNLLEVVKLLLERGAKHVINFYLEKRAVLDYAEPEISEVLKENGARYGRGRWR